MFFLTPNPGRPKTQVRKTKVPEDGICKFGIRKYEYARVENANSENASTNLQRWKTLVQQLKDYFEEFTIFQSCVFSRSAVSRSRPVHLYCTRPVLYTRNRTHAKLMRRKAWVQKSQARRCRVTVLGKLFTPIVSLFIKQRNW